VAANVDVDQADLQLVGRLGPTRAGGSGVGLTWIVNNSISKTNDFLLLSLLDAFQNMLHLEIVSLY
jgi:hypothetical protein